jgi:hypothetical protein
LYVISESETIKTSEIPKHTPQIVPSQHNFNYCQRLKTNLDTASFQDKRDVLDMLAISVTVTNEPVKIDGVIPFEITPSKESDDGANPIHHWTNIGIIVRL